MRRSEGEWVRITQSFARLRAILDSAEKAVADKRELPGASFSQDIAHAGADLACQIARLDAYLRAEADRG